MHINLGIHIYIYANMLHVYVHAFNYWHMKASLHHRFVLAFDEHKLLKLWVS